MIRFVEKEYSSKLTKAIKVYKTLENNRNIIENKGINVAEKAAKKVLRKEFKLLKKRLPVKSSIGVARDTIRSRKALEKAAVEAYYQPGKTANRLIKTVVSRPIHMGIAGTNNLASVACPKLQMIPSNTIGVAAEKVARKVPKYSKIVDKLGKNYDKTKLHEFLENRDALPIEIGKANQKLSILFPYLYY